MRQSFFFRRIGLTAILTGVFSLGAIGAAHAKPNPTSVTPAFGPTTGGTAVTIAGSGFATTGTVRVRFGGTRATNVVVNSSTELTCNTPAHAIGLVTVQVQNNSGKQRTGRLRNGYTYTCAGCEISPVSIQFEGKAPSGTTEPNGIIEPGETSVNVKPTLINTSTSIDSVVTGAVTGFIGPQNVAADITYPTSDTAADYGTIVHSTTGDCGSNCYALGVTIGGSGARPTINVLSDTDWDATMSETWTVDSAVQTPWPWRVHIGNTFTDMPKSNAFYPFVETMVHNAVTFGVGGGLYGPGQTTPRNQMAAFIARADARGDANVPASGTVSTLNNPTVHGAYNCTTGGTSLYADVAPTDAFCKHIHYITNLNVTVGCNALNPPNYCQNTIVTRGVMSVFISRAISGAQGLANPDDAVNDADTDGASRTYDCTNGPSPFLDVPLGGVCKNIGALWVLHVIDGDGAGHFFPNSNVSRQEMAKFIVNGEQLTINGPQ